MTSQVPAYSLCPLKPDPEPNRVLVANLDPINAARFPANACTTTRCAWYLSQIDRTTGRIVAGACAVTAAATGLLQISAKMAEFTVAEPLKESPVNNDTLS